MTLEEKIRWRELHPRRRPGAVGEQVVHTREIVREIVAGEAPGYDDAALRAKLAEIESKVAAVPTEAPREIVREVVTASTYDDSALRAQIMALEGRPPEIPDEIRELILEMADQVKNLNIKLHGVQSELDAMKSLEIVDTRSIKGAA